MLMNKLGASKGRLIKAEEVGRGPGCGGDRVKGCLLKMLMNKLGASKGRLTRGGLGTG